MRDTLFALQQRLAAGERDTLVSPAFLMPLPTLRHAERIPSDALAAMRPAWEQVWFPAAPVRVSVLEGVFVAQEGLVLHPDGTVVAATIEQHAPAAIEAAQRAVRAIAGADIRRFTGDVVLCRKSGCAVYGHWLVELLPKAYLASQFPDPCRFLIQALDGPIGRLVVQTLSSLGIALDRVVEAAAEPVWVERLICIHGLTGHGSYMSPLVIDCLQTIAQRVQPAGAESLFILRPPGSGRRLADERRIARAAQEAGFVVLDPSTLPFTAQIAAFKGARRIVGVMGSALANLAFSRPGTRVDILAPATMPDTFFWFIGNHRRLRMTEIRCDTAPGNASPSWNAALYLDSADEHALFTADTAGPAPEAPLFDPAYYADANPDVVTAACDLLDHYMTTGWRERRIPSATFDGNRYLATYPDVAQSGLNPLLHYMKFGLREGRRRFAARSGEGG